jgi:hypothetical protein
MKLSHFSAYGKIITMKRLSLLLVFLFVVLTITGCGTINGSDFYMVKDGKKISCDIWTSPSVGGCGNVYYEIYNGQTYACGFSTGCNEDQPAVDDVGASSSTQCTPHWTYDHLTDKGESWIVVSPLEDTNNSPSLLPVTFAATTTKTVTVTDSAGVITSLTASADALIATITASVRVQINHTVSQSVKVAIGNSPVLSIPPGKTGYANYGVKVQMTSGHLYDNAKCESGKGDWGMDTTYIPIATGWCLWIDGETPCPSIE